FHRQFDRAGHVFRHGERVVRHLSRAWWNLVIVERREDALRIAAINSVAVAVQHQDVDKVSPFINSAMVAAVERPIAANDTVAGASGEIYPYFIRVRRALRE